MGIESNVVGNKEAKQSGTPKGPCLGRPTLGQAEAPFNSNARLHTPTSINLFPR